MITEAKKNIKKLKFQKIIPFSVSLFSLSYNSLKTSKILETVMCWHRVGKDVGISETILSKRLREVANKRKKA